MPYAEPNSFGEMTAMEWRETYDAHVQEFKGSRKGASDYALLHIRLRKLGYFGTRLSEEITYINEN
jgi:hypothetical protein